MFEYNLFNDFKQLSNGIYTVVNTKPDDIVVTIYSKDDNDNMEEDDPVSKQNVAQHQDEYEAVTNITECKKRKRN